MTNLLDHKIVKIIALITPWLILIFNLVYDDLAKPDIQVSLVPTSHGNLTTATITISNTGKEPATNLRITFNPFNDIINYKKTYYTEEIDFESTGPQNLIGKMKRLANEQKIVIDTTLNVPIERFQIYNVHVAHDAGGTNYYYNSTDLPFALNLTLSISWVTILTLFFLQRFGFLNNINKKTKKSNQSGKQSDVVKVQSDVVAEITPDPFLKISLTENKYQTGDTIKAKLSFSGLVVGETIWIGIFNPRNEEVATKRLKVNESKGETIVDLLTIEDWDESGEYVVKTDTEMGPESSAQFQFTQ